MAVKIGRAVGDYEVLSKLRAGGMATLYIARRAGAAGFARNVALKVVHPHLAQDRDFVDMFIDEAKVSARIQHPNVVHVESFGQHEDDYFMVMEFVHGCSLGQLNFELRERERRLSPAMAVHIIIKVLDGLHAAHEAVGSQGEHLGVVHRDVTPSNVLLSYRGPIKLIDFGVAKAQGRIQQTGVGQIKGKFGYMSPEQAEGKVVDRRADIYAAGVILWELLTQRRYNQGETPMAGIAAARSPSGIHPREYAPHIKPELNEALMRALAVDVNDRPDTARNFRRTIAAAYPEALSIDDQDVSDFVVSVMQGHLQAELSSFPSDISGLYGQDSGERIPSADADRLLHTHTVNVSDVESVLESGADEAPTVLSQSGVEVPHTRAGPDAKTVATHVERRPWPWLLVMLLMGVGVWFGVRYGLPEAEVEEAAAPADVAEPESPEEPAPSSVAPPTDDDVPTVEQVEPQAAQEPDEDLTLPPTPARSRARAPRRPAGRTAMMDEGAAMMATGLREVGGTHIVDSPGF